MDIKDRLHSGTSHNWNKGFRKQKGLHLSYRHIQKDDTIILRKGNYHGDDKRNPISSSNAKNSQISGHMRIAEADLKEMTGERSKREPTGEIQKWKNKGKVWKELEKGGVTNFLGKLHAFDSEITNVMVNSWSNGKVKVNGVYFQITEEVIAEVTGLLMEGHKFFRDKKLSTNAIKDFARSTEEMNKLVKKETFFVTDTIKKL